MDIMQAFNVMLNDVTSVNASRRQVHNILVFRSNTHTAAQKAMAHNGDISGKNVKFAAAQTHRAWRDTCRQIIAALKIQAEEAQRRSGDAYRHADQQDAAGRAQEEASAAAERRASRLLQQAADHRHRAEMMYRRAAACGDPRDAEAFRAAAAREDAAAASAEAGARAAQEKADAHAARAREHRDEAGKYRALAASLVSWQIAAQDAAACGQKVIRVEDQLSVPIGQAQAAAGGLGEVAGVRSYNERPAALTGGGA